MRSPRVLLGALLAFGCAGAFAPGEPPADVEHPRTLARDRFQLDYPGNWMIDADADDYDPDHLFSIDSPGSCHVTLILLDARVGARTSLDAHVEAFVPELLKDPTRTPFSRWGAYEGEGVVLAGKILGALPGSLRLFAHDDADGERTLNVVEFCYDDDMRAVRPGFELIERSFLLRPGMR
jgi:hypothetical protein